MVAWSQGWGEGWTAKSIRNCLEIMEMFCILTVVVVSLVYTSVKSNQTLHFKWVTLLHVHYISTKLIFLRTLALECDVFTACLPPVNPTSSLGLSSWEQRSNLIFPLYSSQCSAQKSCTEGDNKWIKSSSA